VIYIYKQTNELKMDEAAWRTFVARHARQEQLETQFSIFVATTHFLVHNFTTCY